MNSLTAPAAAKILAECTTPDVVAFWGPSSPILAPPLNILEEIIVFIRRFVVFQDPAQYIIAAAWIYHTHAFDNASATPYIYVTSAEPACGKTRVIETLELLARNAKRSANMSQGAMYAAIEAQQPTLFLDEIDAVFSGAANEDLRNILNSGYRVGGNVERQVMGKGGVRDTEQYNTFCPKLLAGIDNGALPTTIGSRCIIFNIKRKLKTETVERMNYRVVTPQAEELKAKIRHHAMTNLERLADVHVQDIESIDDRAFEISEPLLAIAQLFPGWTAKVTEAIESIFSQNKPVETITVRALRIARDLFAEGDRDRITSAEFAAAMDMTTGKASRILTPYGITTTTIKFTGHVAKGYHRSSFTDAWERYL